ncbi:MAG TPA: site-specific DNA-methyltransferase [Phycisphaerales bacterium]|nr:site-specific DNA-methyltransferase [Phycisphaerales bacterium]
MPATIFNSDWLAAAPTLAHHSIDLLYADPPFNTGQTQRDRAGHYEDAWPTTRDYVAWLRARLAATLPALKPTACILLHIDFRVCHHARLLLDDLLGEDRFVNHLIWHYGLGGSSPRRFARKHDDILFYCLDPERYFFQAPMIPATSRRMHGQLKKSTDVLRIPPPAADELLDIPNINNMAAERVGYPTQKPLALLQLLIEACCPPGGTVLDPCSGSGTTLAAALATGRTAIGFDINPQAVEVTRTRLATISPATSQVEPGRTPHPRNRANPRHDASIPAPE